MPIMAKAVTPILLIIVLISAYFGIGCNISRTASSEPSSVPDEIDLVTEAWRIVFEDFVEKSDLDPKKLSRGAIEGLLEALGDPYSTYIDPEQYIFTQSYFEGVYSGIGALVTLQDGQFMVVSPITGAPAERAGIISGDVILEINGEPTKDMNYTDAVLKIRGELGTQVVLRVVHPGEEAPVDIVITREEIKTSSVSAEMLPDNIALINITHFSTQTASDLVYELEGIFTNEVTGIILDLRNNPGGALDAAVSVTSQFLKSGLVLFSIYGDGEKETWEVKDGGIALDMPLVVMVNGDSASSSEVVAGALQDHKRAELVGTRTLGKGSVNHIRELSDGSAIYITIARWYTPNGRLIEGLGLTPDYVVELTAEDIENGDDPQLERAIEVIEYLRNQM
ncbi:S41 family peptidase [Chloroflexota bacterium]